MTMKVIRKVIVIMIIAGLFSSTYASTSDVDSEMSKSTYFRTCNVTLGISNGKATAKTDAKCLSGVTKITIKMHLQKKVSGTWTNLASWSGTKNDVNYSLTKTKSITSGTYRVKSVVSAYKGTACETVTRYSSIKTC